MHFLKDVVMYLYASNIKLGNKCFVQMTSVDQNVNTLPLLAVTKEVNSDAQAPGFI